VVAPNTIVDTSLILMLMEPDAGVKAEEVLIREIWNEQDAHSDLNTRPNCMTYNGVIDAWAKNNDPNAQRILKEMWQR